MNKTVKSLIKFISYAVIAAALMFSTTLPAFAAEFSHGTDADDPAEAAITKILKMPVNTPTPAATFTFTFTKVGIDGLTDSTTKDNMPAIPNVTITFAADDNEVPAPFMEVKDGTKYVVKESDNFLDGIAPEMWLNGEGIYRYQVEETEGGFALGAKEGAVYSKAKYDVEVWVEEDEHGVLFPKYVCVKIVAGSIDEYYDGGEAGGEKVDPTPGGPSLVVGEPTIEDDFSQVIFTNKYWKTDGGGIDDLDSSALEITKIINGNDANLDARFDFDVKVTQPDVIPTLQKYMAYVLDKDGNNVTSTDHYTTLGTDDNGELYIEFTSGVLLEGIKLTNEERLVFADLHIGASVEATEAAADGYIPRYQRTFAGTDEFRGTVKTAFGFPRTTNDPGPHFIGAGANSNVATFTNTRTGATPTGISVDDLPFIVMISAAALALITFLVIKVVGKTKRDA